MPFQRNWLHKTGLGLNFLAIGGFIIILVHYWQLPASLCRCHQLCTQTLQHQVDRFPHTSCKKIRTYTFLLIYWEKWEKKQNKKQTNHTTWNGMPKNWANYIHNKFSRSLHIKTYPARNMLAAPTSWSLVRSTDIWERNLSI